MNLSLKLTHEEYREASRARGRKWSALSQFYLFGGCLAFALGSLTAVDVSTRWLAPIALMVLGLSLAVSLVWSAHSHLDRSWIKNQTVLGNSSISVDDSGVVMAAEHHRSDFDWNGLTRLQETRRLFLLYGSDSGLLAIIPKRSFSDDEQMKEFRGLMKARLLPPSEGFPVKMTA